MPEASANVVIKPIRIQTASGKAETAVLHIFEMQTAGAVPAAATAASAASVGTNKSSSDSRICALHQRSPIQMYMFDCHGALLSANKAALAGLQLDTGPEGDTAHAAHMKMLFARGAYPGGEEQAVQAYEEALNAVFDLRVECHQHIQPYASRKDGTIKWALLEMWPLLDPVDSNPAVLVHRYDITQKKRAELLFTEQKDALEQRNQALERDWQQMLDEKFRLQLESKALAQHLNALLNDKFGSHNGKGFDSDTPIDKALTFLQFIIAGFSPPAQAALELYRMLSEPGIDLRQPVSLENQLLTDNAEMDSEVGQSMLQLLQGRERSHPSIVRPGAQQGGAQQGNNAVVRRAHMSLAYSRHPDLADAPALDVSLDALDGVAAPAAVAPRASQPLVFPVAITPAVERMLQDAETNWQFDIFAYAEATRGNSLSMLTFHLLKSTGLVQEFELNEMKLTACLRKIESGYDPANPYHNSIHVASVVQMTHMLLVHGGVLKSKVMNRTQQLATYWSATVHDYEHGGLNNDFLIKTAHPLAITYNDSSPLENHHLAASSRVLYTPEYCFLPRERAGQMIGLRCTCISQVLGTDMKKHFEILSRFQAAFKQVPGSQGGQDSTDSTKWDSTKVEDKTLLHQMILKCADIGHLTAAPRTHKRWAIQLEEEFFRQGDKERSVGLTVSPLMDRNQQGGMTRSQLGFFNIVGAPLFMAVIELFEDAQPMMQGLQANYHHWESGKIAELTI
ncbi:TPA: Pde-4p [Trebouxia sp. C0004]